jgi:hypothetical protein
MAVDPIAWRVVGRAVYRAGLPGHELLLRHVL